jgi:hypothetical protein
MPTRKQPPEPPWQRVLDELRSHGVLLEDMRSQNRATIEAVEASRVGLERRIEQSDQENRARFAAVEAALQRVDQDSRSRDASLEVAIRDLKVSVQQNSVDIRDLTAKVETLSRLEERVSALERRGA